MDYLDEPQRGCAEFPAKLDRAGELRAAADPAEIDAMDDRVEGLFGLLGKAEALSILRLFALEGGPWRFSELEDRLEASPNTISDRLSELTEAGFLERHSYDEIPPRVEYTWTDSARDLSPAIHYCYDWALDHDLEAADAAACAEDLAG